MRCFNLQREASGSRVSKLMRGCLLMRTLHIFSVLYICMYLQILFPANFSLDKFSNLLSPSEKGHYTQLCPFNFSRIIFYLIKYCATNPVPQCCYLTGLNAPRLLAQQVHSLMRDYYWIGPAYTN